MLRMNGGDAMGRTHYQPWPPRDGRRRKDDGMWRIIAIGMIAAGLLLLMWCIPCWAWAAVCGAALIIGGWWIISISEK